MMVQRVMNMGHYGPIWLGLGYDQVGGDLFTLTLGYGLFTPRVMVMVMVMVRVRVRFMVRVRARVRARVGH